MERRVASDPDTARFVARLRALVRQHGITQTAKILGKTQGYVSNVYSGIRLRGAGVTIDSLRLKTAEGLCIGCGERAGIVAQLEDGTVRCIKCEVVELARVGLVTIEGLVLTPIEGDENGSR